MSVHPSFDRLRANGWGCGCRTNGRVWPRTNGWGMGAGRTEGCGLGMYGKSGRVGDRRALLLGQRRLPEPTRGLLPVSQTPSLGVMMKPEVANGTRRTFSREFKLEAVKLVKERGVAMAQASRDLGCARERVAQVGS